MSKEKQPTHVKIKKCSDGTYWYRNEIGKTFKINYMVNGMYRVWANSSQSFCVKTEDVELIYETDETKQPPAELVEKMKDAFYKPESDSEAIINDCAQIAVQYADFKSSIDNKYLVHYLWQIIRCLEAESDQLQYNIDKAKQLLNKNEDGK